MKRLLSVVGFAAIAAGSVVASAQSPQAPPSPHASASPASNDSEVVWLRKRVEQLEGQLASGGNCGARQKSKQTKSPSMDDQMGMPGTGSSMGTPPSDSSKMKGHNHPNMGNGNMPQQQNMPQQPSGGMQDM